MAENTEEREYMTTSEVAALMKVHPTTVNLWEIKGKLKAERTVGNHRRFLRADVYRVHQAMKDQRAQQSS